MPTTHIRTATESDADDICRIFRDSVRQMGRVCYTSAQTDVWAGGISPEICLARIQTGQVIIAEVEGEPAGWAQFDPSTGEVDMLYVSPEHARRGIGTALMRRIEQIAGEQGIIRLHLRASLNAVPFYRQMGFTEVETLIHRTPGGTEFTCVNMEKDGLETVDRRPQDRRE